MWGSVQRIDFVRRNAMQTEAISCGYEGLEIAVEVIRGKFLHDLLPSPWQHSACVFMVLKAAVSTHTRETKILSSWLPLWRTRAVVNITSGHCSLILKIHELDPPIDEKGNLTHSVSCSGPTLFFLVTDTDTSPHDFQFAQNRSVPFTDVFVWKVRSIEILMHLLTTKMVRACVADLLCAGIIYLNGWNPRVVTSTRFLVRDHCQQTRKFWLSFKCIFAGRRKRSHGKKSRVHFSHKLWWVARGKTWGWGLCLKATTIRNLLLIWSDTGCSFLLPCLDVKCQAATYRPRNSFLQIYIWLLSFTCSISFPWKPSVVCT